MASSKEMEIAIKIAGKVDASLKSALSSVGSGIGTMTKTLTAATAAAAAAVGAIATAAVNVGKEFESSMSQVSATMLIDKTTEEGAAAYATLEDAARECGRTTAFSATEAAEALNYLALAGYDADQAATALPTVLNLAGAGAMDLATASDMVTDSMSALNIEATQDNLTNFADQMAMTASKANTSVSQLGEAILTVGATGSNLAGGTTELNTALGILADNGNKGAEGGTHLRNVILSLQSPTDAASAALDKYTNGVYDAQGNMRSLQDIFGELSSSMENMTQAEKDAVMNDIFNKTDLASANALLANSGERWDELSASIDNAAGACEDMYNIQLDNLDGDIAKLQSGLSDLGISIYEDLNGPLREVTQLGTSMVEELSNAYADGGMAGMVGAVGTCLSEVVDVIADYAPTVVEMGVSLIESFVTGIADNADKVADCAGQVLTTFANGLFTLIPEVLLAGIDIITGLADSIAAELPTLITNGTQAVVNFVSGIIQRLPTVITTAITLVQNLATSVAQNAPLLLQAAIQLVGSLLNGIISMLPSLLQVGIQLIIQLVQGILSNIPLLLNTAVQVVTNLVSGLLSMIPTIIQGGVQLILSLIQGIVAMLPQIAQAAVTLIQTLVQSLVSNLPTILQTAMQMIMTLIQGIVAMLPQIIAEGMNLVLSLVGGIASMLPTILQMAVQLITQFITGLISMLPTILQSGIQMIISLVTGLISMLPTIITAAIQLVLGLVQGIIAAIPQIIAAIPQIISAIIDTLFSTDWLQVGADILSSIKDGIVSMASSIGSSVKNAVLGFFGFGDDDDSSAATESGASTASSYAEGITASSYMATDAMSSLSTDAFSAIDLTSATTAGTDGAAAYTTGLTDGLSDLTLDTSAIDMSALNLSFEAAGTEGITALSTGITAGSTDVTAAATTLVTDTTGALSDGWSTAQTDAESAMSSLADTVKTKAQEAATAVKNAFENLSITIPKPKIPVITTTYKTESYGDGGSVKLPQFSVNWNALGGIFDGATVMNTSQGLQGAGEAGPEALLPLDTLWTQMRSIMTDILQNFSGQSIIEALIEKLQGIAAGGGGTDGTPELAGAGGGTFTYAPVYNLYGTATKEDVQEADKLSQAEFAKLMKEWQRNNDRTKF